MKIMKREYRISRIVIVILSAVGSLIALHNEDDSLQIVGISMFVATAFLISFIGSGISRKMIKVGDKIAGRARVSYYVALLFGILFITYISLIIMMETSDWISDLGTAVLYFFLECCVFILLIVPYIQSVIVLIIRQKLKGQGKTDEEKDELHRI